MTKRELGRLKQAVEEATGLEVSHTFDDLVFIDMGAFLMRFDNHVPGQVHLHFEADCEPAARKEFLLGLTNRCRANGLDLVADHDFRLDPVPGKEEIQVRFLVPR